MVNMFNALRDKGHMIFQKEANYANKANAIEAAWILWGVSVSS